MVEIGKYNKLKITRFVDFGAYLDAGNDVEILMPKKYITPEMEVGTEISVFIYNDSEDRLVAVRETPKATVGEFALLKVEQVNQIGAFLDWGLPKNILVPFREQKTRMQPGRWYIVYIYVDDNTKRVVASAKLDKFLDNTIAKYKPGHSVNILITQRTELGYKVIINNLHWGMIYHNQIFREVNIGEWHQGIIKGYRSDGKIDVIIGGNNKDRATSTADKIVEYLKSNDGEMDITDKSDPEIIRIRFECSKKDFKKALGMLFKEKIISLSDNQVRLL